MPAVKWSDAFPIREKLSGKVVITADMARALILDIDAEAVESLAAEARHYLPQVLAEIDGLRVAMAERPQHTVACAACFGASTPHRPIDESVAMGNWFARTIDWEHDDDATIDRIVRAGYLKRGQRQKTQLPTALSATLVALQPHIASGQLPDRDGLVGIPGIRHKVASMITAVVNPDANIWTIDIHHMRQMLALAGQPHAVKEISYSEAKKGEAYYILEGFWLAYAGQHFPGIPVWATQWATWDVAFGSHQRHAAVWAA